MAAVAAVSTAGVSVDRAVGGVERAIRQADEIRLVRDGAFRGAQAGVAVGQEFEAELRGVGFLEDVLTLHETTLRRDHAAGQAPLADLGETEVHGAVVLDRLADAPEEQEIAADVVRAVDLHFPHRDLVTLLRPGPAVVVRELEGIRPQGIDPLVHARRVAPRDDAEVLRVVRVEGINPAARSQIGHDPRRFGTVAGLDIDEVGPAPALILADCGDDVLSGLPLAAWPGGHEAEPGTVAGPDDVGLIAVALVGDRVAVADVAGIVGRGEGGRGESQGEGERERESHGRVLPGDGFTGQRPTVNTAPAELGIDRSPASGYVPCAGKWPRFQGCDPPGPRTSNGVAARPSRPRPSRSGINTGKWRPTP